MSPLAISFLNFFILVGLLTFKLKVPVKTYVATRKKTIQDEILGSQSMLKQAQAKFDEFSAKLKAVDAEVQSLREQSRQDAEQMKNKVISEAHTLASRVVTDSQSAANSLFVDMKNQILADLSVKVLERTEIILRDRLTGDDRIRLRNEFSHQLESVQ